MNKQSQAILISVSILILAMKDSASLVHTILHCIPDNSWHRHETINTHKHTINPLDVHKYLQHKHSHTHNEHTHVHDLMDHIHVNEDQDKDAPHPEKFNFTVKIDYYFQSLFKFYFPEPFVPEKINYFSLYLTSIRNGYVGLSYQPPQI